MIPEIQMNSVWYDGRFRQLLEIYNIEQKIDDKIYLHWCGIHHDPITHDFYKGKIIDKIPNQVILDVKNNKAKLVFCSLEEPVCPTDDFPIELQIDVDLMLEKFCEEFKIPYNNVIWVSGDLLVESRQKSKKIRAYGYCGFGHNLLSQVEKTDKWELKPITEREFKKDYLCLQRDMKPARIYLTYLLTKNNLLDRGYVSIADRIDGYSFLDKAKNFYNLIEKNQKHLTLNSLDNIQLNKMWHDIADIGLKVPMVLDIKDKDKENNHCNKIDTTLSSLPYYNTSFASIIHETVTLGTGQFLSSSTFKAFIYQHPSIWIGNTGMVQTLRDWGFETWDWLFSEDYDKQPYMLDRIDLIIESLEKICAIEKTSKMLERIHEQNIFNYNHLKTTFKIDQKNKLQDMIVRIINE